MEIHSLHYKIIRITLDTFYNSETLISEVFCDREDLWRGPKKILSLITFTDNAPKEYGNAAYRYTDYFSRSVESWNHRHVKDRWAERFMKPGIDLGRIVALVLIVIVLAYSEQTKLCLPQITHCFLYDVMAHAAPIPSVYRAVVWEWYFNRVVSRSPGNVRHSAVGIVFNSTCIYLWRATVISLTLQL